MTAIVLAAVLALAAILSLAGALLFLVAAFRTSPKWGLVVLLVPLVGGLLFMIKNWPVARLGVLLSAAGAMLAVVAAIAMPSLSIQRSLEEPRDLTVDRRSSTDHLPRGYQVVATPLPVLELDLPQTPGSEPAAAPALGPTAIPTAVFTATPTAVPTATPAPAPTPTADAASRAESGRRAAPPALRSPDEVAGRTGARIELVLTDGRSVRGWLVRVSPQAVRIQQYVGGGTMEFAVDRATVRGVRILE